MLRSLIVVVIATIVIFGATACEKSSEKKPVVVVEKVVVEPKTLNEYKQDISLVGEIGEMKINEKKTVQLAVKNTCQETWYQQSKAPDQRGMVVLDYVWIKKTGERVIQKKGAYLPHNIQPEQSATLNANISAPASQGQYTLRFTMSQENTASFDNKGAKPLDIAVVVK